MALVIFGAVAIVSVLVWTNISYPHNLNSVIEITEADSLDKAVKDVPRFSTLCYDERSSTNLSLEFKYEETPFIKVVAVDSLEAPQLVYDPEWKPYLRAAVKNDSLKLTFDFAAICPDTAKYSYRVELEAHSPIEVRVPGGMLRAVDTRSDSYEIHTLELRDFKAPKLDLELRADVDLNNCFIDSLHFATTQADHDYGYDCSLRLSLSHILDMDLCPGNNNFSLFTLDGSKIDRLLCRPMPPKRGHDSASNPVNIDISRALIGKFSWQPGDVDRCIRLTENAAFSIVNP